MNTKPIRIILIDDSTFALEILSKLLSSAPDIEVVGKVKESREALQMIQKLKPDLVCLDYYMPNINGLELTQSIMETHPLPILVVSGQLNSKESKEIFSVLEAGALDFVPKPNSLDPRSEPVQKLIQRIRVLSSVYVIKKKRKEPVSPEKKIKKLISAPYRLVVIGASTGGPSALLSIFHSLPQDFPVPIICIQHMSKGFLDGFAAWMTSHCQLEVRIMKDKERLRPGVIFLPQEDRHLEINANRQLVVSASSPVQHHRPAIDVTMKSAVQYFGDQVVGVLLTGMGSDGAQGSHSIKRCQRNLEAGGNRLLLKSIIQTQIRGLRLTYPVPIRDRKQIFIN
jgi:two-component system, chemotaxis family, protein-glutamate methylesterase/glutaminase